MAAQMLDWTCSSCALDWVMRAAAIDPAYNRVRSLLDIGYPHNINPHYGLMDASGAALQDVYASYGRLTEAAYLDFDTVWQIAHGTTGQMSGAAWYHWVAIRGVQGNAIWIANSAPGYRGIYDLLSRDDFNRLGPFSVVWLTE